MKNVEEYLNSVGEKGSEERLKAISDLNLGERSEAAKRVLEKRRMRREYVSKGLTMEQSRFLIDFYSM